MKQNGKPLADAPGWKSVVELPWEYRGGKAKSLGTPKRGCMARLREAEADPTYPDGWTMRRIQDHLEGCCWPPYSRKWEAEGICQRAALGCYFFGLSPKLALPKGQWEEGWYHGLKCDGPEGQRGELLFGVESDGTLLQPFFHTGKASDDSWTQIIVYVIGHAEELHCVGVRLGELECVPTGE